MKIKRSTGARTVARNTVFRRKLLAEVCKQENIRDAAKRGHIVSSFTLGDFPACRALVRFAVKTIAARRAWQRTMRIRFRGVLVLCTVTNFWRVKVRLPDGRPIGASGYGALRGED